MERGPDGKYPYKSPVDCALQTFRNEVPGSAPHVFFMERLSAFVI